MRFRDLSALALTLATTVLVGCTGGGGGGTSGAKGSPCTGGSADTLCLESCNLGCSTAGCAISEIAQNQPLYFVFSRDIDPLSVTPASFSMKTSTGEEPVGQLLVNGSRVEFVPEVRVVGASTFFGFRANEVYVLTIAGGSKNLNSVRSTSGTSLQADYSCTLAITRGVVDLDGQPPAATLLTPAVLTNVNQDTQIVLEFSEIIDAGAFATGPSPILYNMRKTRIKEGTSERECNPKSPVFPVSGTPRVTNDLIRQRTVVTFNPIDDLPGEVCVEVEVTNRVKDLAGTPSQGQTFQFITAPSPVTAKPISELFTDESQLDRDLSAGTWAGGEATPGMIGWDGLFGEFDLTLPGIESQSGGVYVFRTEPEIVGSQRLVVTIPKSRSLDGLDHEITDGVLRFSSFVLPKGTTLVFRGSKAPRLYVRGKCDIQGTIRINGEGNPASFSGAGAIGQPGAAGGVAAGVGGQGADKGDNVSNKPEFNGRNGEDVKLVAGHAYASRAPNTGGKGSRQFPLSGNGLDLTFLAFSGTFSDQAAAGGGGGGNWSVGLPGKALDTVTHTPASLGPDSVPGIAFDNKPREPQMSVFDQYLVGGSGGGGGASHPFFAQKAFPAGSSGGGGAGGGGAIGIRAGYRLAMGATGRLEARGGSNGSTTTASTFTPALGGGGAGGSVILQSENDPVLGGVISVLGGAGGVVDSRANTFLSLYTFGGAGAPGYIRLETKKDNTSNLAILGTTEPPATTDNLALLTEKDAKSGAQSLWYNTRLTFPPEWLRYEIDAVVDSVPRKFSDDPSIPGAVLAGPGEPVQFLVQGANLDARGIPDPNSISAWLTYVGSFKASETSLNDRSPNGFRFVLLFDLGKTVVVKKLTLFYKS